MRPQQLTRLVVALGLALVVTALARQAHAATRWRLPLDGRPTVLRAFDAPATAYSAGHRGVDLAAPAGSTVRAAGDGVVAFAGTVAGVGVVTVTHGALRTTYEPVRAAVEVGARVTAGDPLGSLGSWQHCGGRPCLHWGLLRGDAYLDPMGLLGTPEVRLLPPAGPPPVTGGDRVPADRATAAGGDGGDPGRPGGPATGAAVGAALATGTLLATRWRHGR